MRVRSVLPWLLLAGLLGPSVTLTLLRVAQADGGWWVRGVAFTPLAVPLYAAALVLLLGLRLLGDRRGTVVLVVPVVGLVAHGAWLAPLFTGANPAPPAGAATVTVMTANLLNGEADVRGLLAEASSRDVDLLAVQEVTDGSIELLESVGLDQLFPYRAGEAGHDVTGSMLFSRTPVEDVVPLSAPLTSFTATVEIESADWRLAVVHARPPIDAIAGWRDDLAEVLDAVRATEADLVMGDFNASPDHEPMLALADAGWRDVAELTNAGWQPTWPADGVEPVSDLPSPRLVQIDHVLVGERLGALGSQRVHLDGTDHSAVVAEVAAR